MLMARKTDFETLIHCDSCGEDYSPTYKRCPFCGERSTPRPKPIPADDDDGYEFDGQDAFDDRDGEPAPRPRGGKRLASGDSRRAAPAPINWPRVITFLCSLVIIVSALIIIFTVVYPQLHKDPVPYPTILPEEPSEAPSAEPSDPPAEPSANPDDVNATNEPTDNATPAPSTLTGLSFGRKNDADFTLSAGQSHTISLVTEPADWSGDVTWTSSDEAYATVDASGKVTNVNTTSSTHRVTITAAAEGFTLEATVYCSAAAADPTPSPSASEPVTSVNLAPGAVGTITGADGGLRVRSGPGTTYEVLATLVNGNSVTIVKDAGDGWYEITYAGSGGKATTGYIMGEYISVP